MKLYHISKEIEKIHDVFIPRVPSDIMHMENEVIPRVCLSSTIEGCLGAVPWGGINLDELGRRSLTENVTYDELEITPWDKPTSDYDNIYFRVYEFDIDENDSNLMTPEEIWEAGYVDDAVAHREFWYQDSCNPTDTYVVALVYYSEGVVDLLSYEDQLRLDAGEDYEDV